ncbi:hypothetical protein [Amycolatopsis sp. NPDC058986]|uniref:hypothetical protein n=1 Tax=unclassified Amycolatopsis TaxID=2618356 RepID=UPI00366F0FBF
MSIWQTVITVISTLTGTVLGSVLGSVLKGRADAAARVHDWQVTVVNVFGDLMNTLERHYVAMWDLEAARIRGNQDEVDAALAASLTTREAITRPRAQLVVLAPALRPHIDQATHAVYTMDTATDDEANRTTERLEARRRTAKAALQNLETTTAALMGNLGAGLSMPKEVQR